MKVLGIGINPSNRESKYKHFDSPSEPDPTIRKTFALCFGNNNYKFTDLIDKRASKLLDRKKEEILKLCKQNEKSFLDEIRKYKPGLIVLLFKDKILLKFISQLHDRYKSLPRMVSVYQPAYVHRWKHWTAKQYASYINSCVKSSNSV